MSGMRSWAVATGLGLAVGIAGACFTEAPFECERGTNGCPCTAEGTCTGELICNADANCISADCEDGKALCPCYGNDTCDGDLSCINKICHDQDAPGPSGDGGTETATGNGTNAASATSGSGSETSTGRVDGSSGGSTGRAPDDGTGSTGSTMGSSTGPACEQDASGTIPYGPCPTGECPAGQTCVELSLGHSACVQAGCAGADDCLDDPGGGLLTCDSAATGHCLLRCGGDADIPCPSMLPGFEAMECAFEVCGFPVCE